MVSMTGYGFSEYVDENFSLSVEIKSYNSRYLEIDVNCSSLFSPLEAHIQEMVKEVATRGKVELFIRYREAKSSIAVEVDESALSQYKEVFEQIRTLSESPHKATLSDYIGSEGILIARKESKLSEEVTSTLFSLLKEALSSLKEMKQREGEATKADLITLINSVEHYLTKIKELEGQLEEHLKKNLVERVEQLLKPKEFDESRLYQDIALLLAKYSIHEEVIRLQAHIDSFVDRLHKDEPMGKFLDFLSQEMNREINTIGSKSTIVEISKIVVLIKECVENIREQVRNIE